MANIKSQKKRIKTNEKARIRNVSYKSKLRTAMKAVRVACEKNDKANAIELNKKACSIAACEENMEVDDETISKISGLDFKKINEVKNALKKEPVSLDTFVTDDLCIQDYVEDTSYSSPETTTQQKLRVKDVTRLISTLDTREQEIIKRRFGIDDEEPKTLEQIGNALGFSKERIRQLESIAIQKLRKVERVDKLKTYIEE